MWYMNRHFITNGVLSTRLAKDVEVLIPAYFCGKCMHMCNITVCMFEVSRNTLQNAQGARLYDGENTD